MSAENRKIGFIGAGQMAEALARGFINKAVVRAENICATDPVAARKDVFRSFGAVAVDTNAEVRLSQVPMCVRSNHTYSHKHALERFSSPSFHR